MDVSPVLLEPLRSLGAVHFSVVLNLVSNRQFRVYCDYAASWQDRYFRKALYFDDPVFICAPYLHETFAWTDLAMRFPESTVIQEAEDFGLRNGVSIPVQIGDDKHMVSVTLDQTSPPTKSHRDALTRAAQQLVATLEDQTDDVTSRIQSLAYLLASHGLQPSEIAVTLTSARAEIHRRAACDGIHDYRH